MLVTQAMCLINVRTLNNANRKPESFQIKVGEYRRVPI